MSYGNDDILDEFNGSTHKLCESIAALIEMEDRDTLVPHGIGEMARGLLAASWNRLQKAEVLLQEIQQMTYCDSHNRATALGEIRGKILEHRMDDEGITEEDLYIPESDRP
jgi:hypothetical protein